jgi:hypothetical protein
MDDSAIVLKVHGGSAPSVQVHAYRLPILATAMQAGSSAAASQLLVISLVRSAITCFFTQDFAARTVYVWCSVVRQEPRRCGVSWT